MSGDKACPECLCKPCDKACSIKASKKSCTSINGPSKSILIAFDPKLILMMDRQAKAEFRNRADLIREACRVYVGLCDRPERPITINLVGAKNE